MNLELITKIETCARDLAADDYISEDQNVESDLLKIITATTILKNQFVELNAQLPQNGSLRSALSNSQVRHDLRTPLNAILGYSELLIEENKDIEIKDFNSRLTKIRDIATRLLLSIDNYSN